jgi:hypothetical protein
MPSWVVCPRCHFSQTPSERCRRCGEILPSAAEPPAGAPPQPQAPPGPPPKSTKARGIALAAVAAALLLLLWLLRPGRSPEAAGPPPTPLPTAAALDLSGRWQSQYSKVLASAPPRPVLKEISIESGPDGGILAASVVFTDPGRGGAGAAYRTAPDGPRRLAEAAAALAASPRGAALALDFLKLPGWVPARERLWKALEETGRTAAERHYLLVESLESDYLIQAGINQSGFLSFAYFSPAYAPARGLDVLSRVIHPEPGASLKGFRNIVWDLSGAANFLTLELPVTISGPEGGEPDRVTLRR